MLTLRPTGADDLGRVVAIEAAADTAQWLGETGWAWHERARADPDQDHVVVELDGVVVGFGVMAGLRTADRVIELRRMVVHPEFRGCGLGRSLLRSMRRRAHALHGASRVWLDVKPDNRRARKLYESEGFAPTAAAEETASELIVMVHAGATRADQRATGDRSTRHE
jgi:diamine N-acetyltransferase